MFAKCLPSVCQVFAKCLPRILANAWQTLGKHLANTWQALGKHLANTWQTLFLLILLYKVFKRRGLATKFGWQTPGKAGLTTRSDKHLPACLTSTYLLVRQAGPLTAWRQGPRCQTCLSDKHLPACLTSTYLLV